MIFNFENGCKNDLTIITKNHVADPEKEFLAKSISKSNGCASAMPIAWELKSIFFEFSTRITENVFIER